MVELESDTELLLDIADSILHPKDRVVYFENVPKGAEETGALALRLRSRPDLCFRALMERWDRFRIVRELY